MYIVTARKYILNAARKSDKMLEPYEWKRSRTVLREERDSNVPDLLDTSSKAGVIENGGCVAMKSYSLNYSKIDGYGRPKYELIESEDLTMTQYEELKKEIEVLKSAVDKLTGKMIYNYQDSNMPEWARPTVQKMLDKGILKGNENGELGLTDEMLRMFVMNDRAGVYDMAV